MPQSRRRGLKPKREDGKWSRFPPHLGTEEPKKDENFPQKGGAVLSQKTGSDYKNAIQALEPLQHIYDVSGDVVQCLDCNCFEGHLHSDSSFLIKQASEAIQYLCDEKNNYLLTLENLIVKFLPKPTANSFETYICIIQGYLNEIKSHGYSEDLQKNLEKSIRNLSKELDRISASLEESKPDGHCDALISSNSALSERAIHLQGYRERCIRNRCGMMGHGNPAVGVQNRVANLSSDIGQSTGPLCDVNQFCREVTDGFSACVKQLTDLQNSDPAHHPDEALSQISRLDLLWNQLKTIIQA